MPCAQTFNRKTHIPSFIPIWKNMLQFKYISYLLIAGAVFIQYVWSFKERKKKKKEVNIKLCSN